MSYRYDKKKKSTKSWYFASIILVTLALFTPFYSWLFDAFEKPLVRSWENKQEFFDGTENFLTSFYGKTRILEKNKEIKQQIQRLEIDNLRTQFLANELEQIFAMQNIDPEITPARIISHGKVGALDTVVLNQGLESGLDIGDEVTTHGYVSLGSISEVYDTSARVMLYSNTQNSRKDVLFPHDVVLTAHGYGNGTFIIESPREVEAAVGDVFYDLDESRSIIGIVQAIEFDPRDPFKKVYLSHPVSLAEVHLVGVKKQNTQ